VLSPGGLGAANYKLTFENSTLTIARAPLALSTVDVSKVFDGTVSAAGAAKVVGGQLFGQDSISGGSFAFLDPAPGTGKTVTVAAVTVNDGNNGGNYSVTYQSNKASTILEAPVPPPVVVTPAPVATVMPPKPSAADPAPSSSSATASTTSGTSAASTSPAAASADSASSSGTAGPSATAVQSTTATSETGAIAQSNSATAAPANTPAPAAAASPQTGSAAATPAATRPAGTAANGTQASAGRGAQQTAAKAGSAKADAKSEKVGTSKSATRADAANTKDAGSASAKTKDSSTTATTRAKAVDPAAKAKSVANANRIASRFAAVNAGVLSAAAGATAGLVAKLPSVTATPIPAGYMASGGMLPDQLGAITKSTIPAVAPVCDGKCSPEAANIAVAMQMQSQAAGSLSAPGDSFAESFHEIPWRGNSGANKAAKPRNITSYTEVLEEVNFINVLNLFIVP
jgi:hypothetical protein